MALVRVAGCLPLLLFENCGPSELSLSFLNVLSVTESLWELNLQSLLPAPPHCSAYFHLDMLMPALASHLFSCSKDRALAALP